jgi:hypothetical protein
MKKMADTFWPSFSSPPFWIGSKIDFENTP